MYFRQNVIFITILFMAIFSGEKLGISQTYKVVDTGQTKFYTNMDEISAPAIGEVFYGQDAQFNGHQPSYTDNGDGTISDNITGLMWSKSPDLDGDGDIDADDKLTYSEALAGAETFSLAGYNDWRLPSIKELYSLIMFYGLDPSGYNGSNESLVPFINTEYFEFGYGDEGAGERIIDAQFATSTKYVSTTMGGNETMFGVNFADGRIKGYPTGPTPADADGKGFYVMYVRGNTNYGVNDFENNGDGTITDNATGLMWTQADNEEGLTWEEALSWAQQKNNENYLGHNDWRLPNVKELQSIVDYTRSPATTNSAAINPMFQCTKITDEGGNDNYPFYWNSTTHANMVNGGNAAYVAFGEGLGWMTDPFGNNATLMDVHGAGCQRSDPKEGDPADYPYGHGPQGDVIRIYNYVRLVRDVESTTDVGNGNSDASALPDEFRLEQNYPNPFNASATISFFLPETNYVSLKVFSVVGKQVATLVDGRLIAGYHSVQCQAKNLPSGIYFYRLQSGSFSGTKRMILLR